MKSALLVAACLSLFAAAATAELIITEAFYDEVGLDETAEWVEILNTGPDAVDLTGYQLCNGGTSYAYSVNVLSGTIDPCQVFVVGGPASSETNGSPVYDLVLDFTPDFQNSGTASDGIALFAPGDDPLTACPVSAILYGGENTSNLLDASCSINPPAVGDAVAGQSIERIAYPEDTWVINAAPAPGVVGFACGGTSAERKTWGEVKSVYR